MRTVINNFLDWLLGQIAVDPRQLQHLERRLASRTKVRYVVRYPSYIEEALLRRFCERHDLPIPERSSIVHLRLRSSLDFVYLLAKRHRTRITERLTEELLSAKRAAEEDSPVYVPVKLFAGRGPAPIPKRLRFLPDFDLFPLGEVWTAVVLVFYRSALAIDLGPVFAPQSEVNGQELLNSLSRSFYRKERKMRGSRLLRRRTVEQIVLSGSQYEAVLERLATTKSESRTEVEKRGKKVFAEIAAMMGPRTIAFFRALLHFTFNRIFSKVEIHGVEELRSVTEQHPVVLLPRHRSHLDYLFLTFVLYQKHLAIPYVAAGNNLNIWPLGSLLRRSGAFFIRRKIENDPLYKIILNRYLTYLIKQGHEIEFFIEGGRSRTGAVGRPRLGLLKYVIRTIQGGARRDVYFVPVGITYERVPEDRSLTTELAGAKKISESLSELWKLRNFFKVKLHSAVVRFDTPISLRDFTARNQLADGDQSTKLTETLGLHVAQRLIECSPLSLHSVVAIFCSLLRTSEFTVLEFEQFLNNARPLLERYPLTPDLQNALRSESSGMNHATNTLSSARVSLGELLNLCVQSGLLVLNNEGLFCAPPGKTLLHFFYKNSALSAFFPAAAQSIAQSEEEYRLLHECFVRFLLLPPYERWRSSLERVTPLSNFMPLLLPFLALRLGIIRCGRGLAKFPLQSAITALSDIVPHLPPPLLSELNTSVVAEEVTHTMAGALLSRTAERGGEERLRRGITISFDSAKHSEVEVQVLETMVARALGLSSGEGSLEQAAP